MSYQVFSIPGTTGTLTVPFNPPFTQQPIVITTPFYRDQKAAVGSVSTVTQVSEESATIVSGNSGANYFLNVLALDPGKQSLNWVPATAGSIAKTTFGVVVPLSARTPSVNLLSSLYVGSSGSVGSIDTVIAEDDSSITVMSGNAGATTFTQYLNTVPCAYEGVQAGIANKQGGLLRVYFQSPWESPPIVFASPWLDGGGQGVGSIETVSTVTNSYFEIASGNSAQNYFVSWLAII